MTRAVRRLLKSHLSATNNFIIHNKTAFSNSEGGFVDKEDADNLYTKIPQRSVYSSEVFYIVFILDLCYADSYLFAVYIPLLGVGC